MYKILSDILLSKLSPYAEEIIGNINVDFYAGQLLIIYSAFIKYVRKNGNTMKQCISCLYTCKEAYDSVRREVLYNILIEFGIPMKLVRLIKMCLRHIAKSGYARICLTCFLLGMV